MQDDEKGPTRPAADALLRVATEEVRNVAYGGKYRAEITQYKDAITGLIDHGYSWEVAWLAFRRSAGSVMSFPSFRRHCRALGIKRQRGRSPGGAARQGPSAQVAVRLSNGLPVFKHSPVPELGEIYGDDD